MFKDRETILNIRLKIKERIKEIDEERAKLQNDLEFLQRRLLEFDEQKGEKKRSVLLKDSDLLLQEKINLLRKLFRGREDVYPKLWESKKTGKKGYSPVCENEWVTGLCKKPKIKCAGCENRILAPLTDYVIRQHLEGKITIGIYPLLTDETCYFLAADFDGENWAQDALAFLKTAHTNHIPAYLERSRSGNGGHVWIFFSEPVQAVFARQMGSILIEKTMDQRYRLDMRSYDRLFPNQDTLPKGGFGNLIALPLQKFPIEKDNSLFIDEECNPYPDQWTYLSNIDRLSEREIFSFIEKSIKKNKGKEPDSVHDNVKPWEEVLSLKHASIKLTCELPDKVTIVYANRLYLKKENLPPQLLREIKRLSSFHNPEFYKKQSMRLSTVGISRIVCCAEELNEYVTIPRGCLEDLIGLLTENNISLDIREELNSKYADFKFYGDLTNEQKDSFSELLKHDIGILVASPGMGKTVLGTCMIAERKTNTLILVHRKMLMEQWIEQISSFLNISVKEIGRIGGGKYKPNKIIDVAMLQSLEKKGEIDTLIKNYGYIIVDECHHIPAVSFERVMNEANARYITGLTATIERRDGHHPIIMMQCGPIRFKSDSHKSQSDHFTCKLISRATHFVMLISEGDSIHKIWPELIKDDERNRMIFNDVMDVLAEGRCPIVITERIEHINILQNLFESTVDRLIILHGRMKSKTRVDMMRRLQESSFLEKRLVLATGSYIGEGFDDPRLDTLFLTMPVSFKGRIIQYAGRLNRTYYGKKELRIYDYVDTRVPVLERMYMRRTKAYKSLGFK